LAEHHASKQQVAVKQFTKKCSKAHRLDLLQSEVEVYLRLDHPNICRLLHAYESKHDVWLVMELCGCELYSRLCQQKVYSERDAAEVVYQMLQAVGYLHTHNMVHRDLKLENIVLDQDGHAKLADFGLAKQHKGGRDAVAEAEASGGRYASFTKTFCGSYGYAAPVVNPRRQVHGFVADLSVMSDVRRLGAEVARQFPVIHGLLNNAGAFAGGAGEDAVNRDWSRRGHGVSHGRRDGSTRSCQSACGAA